MPPIEQRYTPVPGFEHLSRDFERYNTGIGDSASGSNGESSLLRCGSKTVVWLASLETEVCDYGRHDGRNG